MHLFRQCSTFSIKKINTSYKTKNYTGVLALKEGEGEELGKWSSRVFYYSK